MDKDDKFQEELDDCLDTVPYNYLVNSEIKSIITDCLKYHPNDRPDASTLFKRLKNAYS